jgi:xanthine dehydrogenase iron-sulfur cluster and FAD-binding subunit A
VGRPWTEETVRAAADALDFRPLDDHRGSAAFRRVLARNLLIGFFEETRERPFVPLTDRHAGTVILGENA